MAQISHPVIRPFRLSDESAALAAQQELVADDFDFLPGRGRSEPWADFVDRLAANKRGEAVPEGWVPSATYAATLDGVLAGRVGIRYELNDYLRQFAGHIGYAVRPAFRRRGLAIAMLQHGLNELAGLGTKQALITCDETNAASRATIKRCGGVPDEQQPVVLYNQETRVLRFWVPTS